MRRVVRVRRNDTGDVTALAGGTEAGTAEAVRSTRNHALSGSVKVVHILYNFHNNLLKPQNIRGQTLNENCENVS